MFIKAYFGGEVFRLQKLECLTKRSRGKEEWADAESKGWKEERGRGEKEDGRKRLDTFGMVWVKKCLKK